MPDALSTAAPMGDTLAELVEEFDLLGDWEGRIEYVIELGKDLAPLPDADRIDANKVPGCAAQVWLAVRREDGRLRFLADSDSALSKGNIALLRRPRGPRPAGPALGPDAPARQRPQRHGRPHSRGGPGGERRRLTNRRLRPHPIR